MSPQKNFIISLAMAMITVILFLIFEPGNTPLYQAIILLLSFAVTVIFFAAAIIKWLKGNY